MTLWPIQPGRFKPVELAVPTAEVGTFSIGQRDARGNNNPVTFNLTANAGGGVYRAANGAGSFSYLCQTGTSTIYAGRLKLSDGLAGQTWQMTNLATTNSVRSAKANAAVNAAAVPPALTPSDFDLCAEGPGADVYIPLIPLITELAIGCIKGSFAKEVAVGFIYNGDGPLGRGYATQSSFSPPQGPPNSRFSRQAANSFLAPATATCLANPCDLLAQNAPFGYQFAAASVEGSLNAAGGLVNGQNVSNRSSSTTRQPASTPGLREGPAGPFPLRWAFQALGPCGRAHPYPSLVCFPAASVPTFTASKLSTGTTRWMQIVPASASMHFLDPSKRSLKASSTAPGLTPLLL